MNQKILEYLDRPILLDFRKLPCELDGKIDLIITDPPYPRAYQELFNDLGELAARVLRDGGSLLTFCGHYQLPYTINALSKHLKYRWTICHWQADAAHARMVMGIEVLWKPVLWFVKGTYPQGRGFVRDAVISQGVSRPKLHKWEQAPSLAEYFIPRLMFSKEGIFMDPMAGTFTFPLVAAKLGYQWIGCDTDPDCVEIGKRRFMSNDKKSKLG